MLQTFGKILFYGSSSFLGFLVLLGIWGCRWERRARPRYESWFCPRCDGRFGRQGKHLGWSVKRDPTPEEPMGSGPILHCPACDREFMLRADGIEINEDFCRIGVFGPVRPPQPGASPAAPSTSTPVGCDPPSAAR